MMRGSLRLYTAATEVIREKIALLERQKLRASEGDHIMSIHYFIPTWLQKMTVEDSIQVGMTDRGSAAKGELLDPQNPMKTAVDFHLLVNKHVSCALGNLADTQSHTRVCSGTPQKPSKAQIKCQLITIYSFTSFYSILLAHISCVFLRFLLL